MDSQEDDFFHESGSDWAEEVPDAIDINEAPLKPYKIPKEEDIKHLQENDISTVSTVLSVPRGVACSLLCRNSWNLTSAYDQWFAAAPDLAAKPADQGSTPKHLCNICFEKTRPRKMASAACGHLFCTNCWKTYIATSINDGAACLTLRCPEPRCEAAVTSDMVEKIASESNFKKYHQHLRRYYVESNRNRKWCLALGCNLAIELDVTESETYDVVCDCSHSFCFNCTAERHRPVACTAVAEWMEKNKSKGESAMWILAYAKACPKCNRPIQKNQGCNHMTCKAPCRFHFCWICLSPWKTHHRCNKYTIEDNRKKEAESEVTRYKRYGHYYERWDSNDKARKMAVEGLERARRRCTWEILKFVVAAWEQIVECRRVLKWGYV